MPIVAKRKKREYSPAPEGLHLAVCCDVTEPALEGDPFNPGEQRERLRIVWQLEEINPKTDKPFEVSQTFTFSLHEKSNLSKLLEMWLGTKLSDEDRDGGFDLEILLGECCQLQVVHNVKDNGDVFANVGGILPLGKGMQKIKVAEGYVRRKDRDQ